MGHSRSRAGGEPPWLDEVELPLSKVSNEMDAKTILEPLIDYVKKKIGNDPQALAQTPLHLMANSWHAPQS